MQKIILARTVLLMLVAASHIRAQAPQAPTPDAADRPTNPDVTDVLRRAEAGDAAAQVILGRDYFEGRGVAQDVAEGVKWFRKAAEQGNADGQNNLAVAYVQGKGVPKDGREAAALYRRAADQGHMMAQFNLAQTYSFGLGIPKDFEQAAIWYRKAAEQGLPWAQHDLAIAYLEGEGVKKDRREAEAWLMKASAQEYAPSTFAIGVVYWKGEFGRAFDVRTVGLEHFRKAAAQGDPRAALNLGGIYLTSRDRNLPQDAQQGCMWMAVGARLANEVGWNRIRPTETKMLEEAKAKVPVLVAGARKNLTAAQIIECERQAEEWLVANPSRISR